MAVSIRGHGADLKEFQRKFNGNPAAGREICASEQK
jgi:hypothetical protein